MFFGRKTINENGEIFINMYYIDINKQVKFEEILPIVLSAVVASSANLVFIKDSDYRYVSCNKKFANAIGYDKISDVIGKTDFDLVPEKEASEYRAQEKHIEETKESQVIYTKIPQTKDDKIRYAETSKFPLLDGDNKVIGFYGVVRDIDSSNNKDLQLKNINSCIPGGFVTSTYEKETNGEPQLIINYFNNDFGKMLGYNNDEHEIIKPREAFPFIYEEDLPMIKMKLQQLVEFNIPIEGTLRMYHKNGSIIWVTHKAEAVARFDDKVIINAVFLNTTDQQLYIGRLRMSEEENRLAIKHSKSTMGRFSIKEKTLVIPEDIAKQIGIQATMYNVPDELIRKGLIAKDSEKKYLALFEDIFNGKPNGEAVYQYLSPDGWRWFESNYSTIYNENNQPTNAIITFLDVTEQLEKEVIYKKWNQSLNNKDPKKYTLFRGNLNKNIMYEIAEGTLLSFVLNDNFSYTDNKNEFINKCVYKEDAELFNDFVEIKFLLANYYQGKRNFRLEFRGVFDNVIRWLLLTIELIEYPNSNDIEAYLLFEDIDEMKKAEIERNTLMEIDPLTGLLNRKTFKDKVNMLIANSENIKAKEKNCFALFMLDIDGFKMVNDSFGHAVGDETLIDFAKIIRKLFRKEDYVCRFGGDEYMMCINNISDRSVIIQKVKQLCALTRKSFSLEVKISSSIGISLYPFDGNDFETLYHKADLALYHVKATGKSNYAFYNEDMIDESPKVKLQISQTSNLPGEEKKRRMLIVDNNEFSRKMLEEMFKDEFIIETVEDAEVALIRLHRYGIGISVVLLNLIMPNMNGFYFLKKMRESVETSMIPVIVISELDDRETSQKAIKYGTVDYITKPIDVDLLKIRVASAIAKSENEYLKVQNRYLTVEHEEVTNYKTIIENDGIIVIKYEKSSEKFQYDHNINSYLVGNYDNRSLWEILIKDKVASLLTVLKLQKFIDDFIHNDTLISDQIKVRLTSVSKIKELYIVKVIKRLDEAYYGDKLIITIMKENK